MNLLTIQLHGIIRPKYKHWILGYITVGLPIVEKRPISCKGLCVDLGECCKSDQIIVIRDFN